MKTVAVYPFPSDNDSNTYVKMILENAEAENLKFIPFENSVSKTFKMDSKKVQEVYLNWYENFEAPELWVTFRRLLKRWFILHLLKRKHIDIVPTVHNRQTHDTKWGRLSKAFTKYLYGNAKNLLILCENTRDVLKETFGEGFYKKKLEKKCVKIPHPTYTSIYPISTKDIRKAYCISDKDMVLLYLGAIKKYKNVELIIRLAKYFQRKGYNGKFILAGGCSDSDYLEQLRKETQGLTNLILVPHFIGDEEIDGFMKAADVFICPLNIESSLNSGSCMLGLTYGKQVICPKIGTIQELNYGMPYTYVYQTKEEHYTELEKAAEKAYSDFTRNVVEYREKETELKCYMERRFSPTITGKKYYDFFMKEDN